MTNNPKKIKAATNTKLLITFLSSEVLCILSTAHEGFEIGKLAMR
jgi:hypothetical protein